jgi:8-oxo-dGTP pyrophosphatase MutT (NUDIX family)
LRLDEQKKAGAVIYDSVAGKILLVQSYGNKWGSPKGSMEMCDGGSPKLCAIREVQEETGIVLKLHQLKTAITVNETCYYIVDLDSTTMLPPLPDCAEITGIGWVRYKCCASLPTNSHTRRLLKYHHIASPQPRSFYVR